MWFDDVRSGNFDLGIGAIVSTLIDPSDYFNGWYKDGGAQNYSNWKDPRFEALLPQIDREVDAEKRLGLIRQAEAIMEENPPLLPVAWEKIIDGWYNYVKGHNPTGLFRHLRRRAVGYDVAGQVRSRSRASRQPPAGRGA